MLDFITVPLVVGICVAGVYGLFELFVRRKERLAIIEKIGDKLDASAFEGKMHLPSYGSTRISFNSLKTGCLLAGLGFGLLVGFLIHMFLVIGRLNLDGWYGRDFLGAAYCASILLFGGIGLLISFVIEMNISRKNKQQ